MTRSRRFWLRLPFTRCPDHNHRWRNIFADEILMARTHRAYCVRCGKKSKHLRTWNGNRLL